MNGIPVIEFSVPGEDGFNFFWLKYVTGFDPTTKCAKSLKGFHSKAVKIASGNPAIPVKLAETDTYDYLYLCGVSAPYVHANNFHLVMRHQPGGKVTAEAYNGAQVIVTNVEEVPIEPLPEPIAKAVTEHQAACRNYQFGWWAYEASKATVA